MKLKPTRLFGVEQKTVPCYFIHVDGEGYWFLSYKEKTVGEARLFQDISSEIEAIEIDSNWLILEISKVNKDALLKEIKEKNFTVENREINTLSKSETERLIEIYVRTLISDLDFVNPVLWKYKQKLEDNISKNRELFFEYQMKVVETFFKCRVILDPSLIVPDDTDIEKGYILKSDTTTKNIVGIVEEFNYNTISETLALKIYQFANRDLSGQEIETTAIIEAKQKTLSIATLPDTAQESEKKDFPLPPPAPSIA